MAYKVSVIGIGPGDPEQVTVQAVRALQETAVFFLIEKGGPRDELARARLALLDRYRPDGGYRVVALREEERPRSGPYREGVKRWREDRAHLLAAAFQRELGDGKRGGLLVWGDPSLYDGTLSVLAAIEALGVPLEVEVVPGISALQALAARHRTTLTQTAGELLITTGRRLAEGRVGEEPDLAVMLDGAASYRALHGQRYELLWGAYLGLEGELLVRGPLAAVEEEVAHRRREARAKRGWIMDTYLLRRARRQ